MKTNFTETEPAGTNKQKLSKRNRQTNQWKQTNRNLEKQQPSIN